jgi:hypothetical protein
MSTRALRWPLLALFTLAAACGTGAASEPTGGTTSAGGHGGEASTTASGLGGAGAGTSAPDGGAGGAVDDGTPVRQACTENLGHALTATYGRLDGYLVAIVPMGQHTCNGDSTHVHLQVRMNGAVYDVAVNTDVLYTERDAPLPDGAWSEGWHTNVSLDYAKNFALHSAVFTTTTPADLQQKLETELAQANHISIFATGYGPDGVHDVHRHGYAQDGAIAIDPLSPNAHLLMFCFADQGF